MLNSTPDKSCQSIAEALCNPVRSSCLILNEMALNRVISKAGILITLTVTIHFPIKFKS